MLQTITQESYRSINLFLWTKTRFREMARSIKTENQLKETSRTDLKKLSTLRSTNKKPINQRMNNPLCSCTQSSTSKTLHKLKRRETRYSLFSQWSWSCGQALLLLTKPFLAQIEFTRKIRTNGLDLVYKFNFMKLLQMAITLSDHIKWYEICIVKR